MKCIICHNDEYRNYKVTSEYHFLKCNKCNLVYNIFDTSEDEVKKLYTYYDNFSDSYDELDAVSYKSILANLEAYRETNNLLDHGCGVGQFVYLAKKENWNSYGVDFSSSAIRKAKSIHPDNNVLNGTIKDLNFKQAFFDVVTSYSVIEHIPNLCDDFKEINRVLRIGGLFYSTTPNFNGLSRKLLRMKSPLFNNQHYILFNPKNIIEYYNQNGFKVVNITTKSFFYTQMNLLFINGHKPVNPKKSIESSNNFRHKCNTFQAFNIFRHNCNKLLNQFKMGDDIIISAVKINDI